MANVNIGVKVESFMFRSVRFAYDTAGVAISGKGLQKLLDNINRVAKNYGMLINVKKTKVYCAYLV